MVKTIHVLPVDSLSLKLAVKNIEEEEEEEERGQKGRSVEQKNLKAFKKILPFIDQIMTPLYGRYAHSLILRIFKI